MVDKCGLCSAGCGQYYRLPTLPILHDWVECVQAVLSEEALPGPLLLTTPLPTPRNRLVWNTGLILVDNQSRDPNNTL